MADPGAARIPTRRVAILAGGTAGHVYPAIAVADAYRAVVPRTKVLFIGTASGFERRLVQAAGYPIALLPGAPFFGVGWGRRAHALVQLARGTHQAGRLLRRERIELVIGFGGYASAAPLLAARSLGLPRVIHEANAAPGLTHRLLGRLVDRVYLSFAAGQAAFPRTPTLVVGTPVRQAFVDVGAAKKFGTPPFHILVTGGSLGSRFLNRRVPDLVQRVAASGIAIEVRHQSGENQAAEVQARYAEAGLTAAVWPYIDDMASAYAWADVAVTCAGSITLAELAAAALPALVVPLAAASEDHQRANAEAFAGSLADGSGGEGLGSMYWVTEDGWDPQPLAHRLIALLSDAGAWTAASRRLRTIAANGAAARLVNDCEETLNRAGSTAKPPACSQG